MKKVQYAPGEKLSGEILKRTGQHESASIVARRMATRYARICRESLPFFTLEEWRTIAGSTFAKGDAIRRDIGLAWPTSLAYELVTCNLGAKFGADSGALYGKIEGLSMPQRWAVLDYLDQYFAAIQRGESPTLPGEQGALS